jgi:uncharacterized protein (TIGR02145 family)
MKNGLRIVSIAALALLAFSLNQKHTQTEFETVFIGTQTWMVYNLNTTTFSDGTEIPEAKTYAEWAEAAKKKTPAWCHFYNDSSGNEIIGKLYNWYAISSNHGLAPQGWRVPTNADWALMIETLGGKTEAAKRMKNKFGWVPDEQGNNESGFKALPSGSRYPDGTFGPEGIYAAWWSSTQDGANHAWVRGIGNQKGNVTIDSYHKASGFAVRCIKEDTL